MAEVIFRKGIRMKRFLILLSFFGGFAVMAQTNNAPLAKGPATNSAPVQSSQSLQAQASVRTPPTITLNQAKPNEIIRGKASYSGIAVEAAKKRKLLQLINPAAPAEYGSPEDNLVRDPINGRVEGLKIFAIRF